MTTNQTIDGVPRELLGRLLAVSGTVDYARARNELRALLHAPAGTDWKAAHDTVLKHHRETFAEHVAEIERLKSSHPQGEPLRIPRITYIPRELTAEMLDELTNGDKSKRAVMKVRWAAMLLMLETKPRLCDCNQGRLPCTCIVIT